jgi:hypothetical protein
MHLAKDKAVSHAHEEAATIAAHAKERQENAVAHILATIRGNA